VGVDESPEMLARLAENDPGCLVRVVRGDMVDDQPSDVFDLVFISYNTLFNVVERSRQRACLANIAARLSSGGVFVIDACVFDVSVIDPASSNVARGESAERRGAWLVRTTTTFDAASGTVNGSITSRHDDGRVAVRPFTITYSSPDEIDAMCAEAGLSLVERHGSWQKTAFDDDSARHVSVYRNLR
jgi:hypothetical protein